MSGEHGDGRARSALLPAMYSPAALDLFGQVKACFDPDNLLNPGVLVDPRPVDADLRTDAVVGRLGRFADEVHRCTGVGKCLADTTPGARRDVPVVPGHPGGAGLHPRPGPGAAGDDQRRADPAGWRSPEVHRALDLCLSCKGCARDCPTGIDMAAYKAEVLDHTYRGRLRPRSHYALGWLPRWSRLITRMPALARLVNLLHRYAGAAPAGPLGRRGRPAPDAAAVRRTAGAAAGSRCRPARPAGR